MRHYVPKKNNADVMPHDVYMQMLYVIRDYSRNEKQKETVSGERLWQWKAVCEVINALNEAYKKRSEDCGALDSLHAFFDYAYYSCMFTGKGDAVGAGKRSWNLFRCRFASLVAQQLGLLTDAPQNHRDA